MSDERFPLISILIPNYNYVWYVATAVDSALAQTYPNIEVVVSDNCSTDGAWELLNEKYGADPRVRLYQNERNVGMAANFDRLLGYARGTYLMCLSSDDFLFPDHLTLLEAQLAKDPAIDVAWCTAYFADDDGRVFSMRQLAGQFPADYVDARDELVENFTTVCPVCFPCALFKSETLLEPGMCGEADNGQDARDWEVIIRLALAGKKFAYVARPTMAIRLHADQFSGDAYHRSGRNVLDYAAYVKRYMDHPEFVRRMRGRERGVAQFLDEMVAIGASHNGGVSPFDAEQHAGFTALGATLRERAAVYAPALVRESKVSVVIQHAGVPYPLLRALDSVAAQTTTNWEIVLVDHSPISVESLVQGHAAAERISYLRLPQQSTAATMRNLGLRMIRGEYVAFLEPDDLFAPDHLARAIDAIAEHGAKVASATARLVLERTNGTANVVETLGQVVPFGGDAESVGLLPIANSVPLSSLVFYRGLVDDVGRFDESFGLLEDWDYVLRLALSTPIVTTGVMTADITGRLGLFSQRLGVLVPHYLATLDRIYAKHAVDPALAERRAAHRREVAAVLAVAKDWIGEPRGLGAFLCSLAGRTAFAAAAG
ncbi:MAG TPA: glycosyltransferase family 2 protein [Candidatus Elarobacter sp.]